MSSSTITTTVPAVVVRVQTSAGAVKLKLAADSTIRGLKSKLQEKTKIPENRQILRLQQPDPQNPTDPIDFNDDDRTIGDVLNRRVLHLQDSSHMANDRNTNGGGTGPQQGHQFGNFVLNGTNASHGDTIDSGFHGEVPSNRGFHTFEDVDSTGGVLKVGDHFRAGQEALPQDLDSRGNSSSMSDADAANAQGPRLRGHQYGAATTSDTHHTMGDQINSGWHGSVPAGMGSHRYGTIKSTGGSVHRGNKYGASDLDDGGSKKSDN